MYLDRKALDRAGILDPALRDAYTFCRRLLDTWEDSALLGASTILLPMRKRPAMWALAGFLWSSDALLDTGDPALRPQRYEAWCERVRDALATGRSDDPVCAALLHAMREWGMAPADIDAHLSALRADLTVTEYATYADLERHNQHTNGPVVRLGLRLMEPVAADALDRAMAFAMAIQLMDYICDVPEDVGLGRTYLPLADLRAFGLAPADLGSGESTPALRGLIRHQAERVRRLWAYGRSIVDAVEPGCRMWLNRGVREFELALTELERRDYDISMGPPRFGMRAWGVLAHVH